jgi:Uma2 family endonuclease
MINASRGHAKVCMNLILELGARLDRTRFALGAADFAVETAVGVRSPDVVVDLASARLGELSTAAPIFIAEVLSPSTTGIDFTAKLDEYTAIGTLETYLICAQDEPRAWVWSRSGDGTWPKLPMELAGRDGTIALGGLGVEIGMAAIFRGIPDAPTPA